MTEDNIMRIIDELKKGKFKNDYDNPYNNLMIKLAKEKGFDGLPKIIKGEPTKDNVLYRKTDRIDELLYGDLSYSGLNTSKVGAGIYFSRNPKQLEGYDGELYQFSIADDVKIINVLTLNDIWMNLVQQNKHISLLNHKFYDIICLELGIDGYYIPFRKNVVMLNRGKVNYYDLR